MNFKTTFELTIEKKKVIAQTAISVCAITTLFDIMYFTTDNDLEFYVFTIALIKAIPAFQSRRDWRKRNTE